MEEWDRLYAAQIPLLQTQKHEIQMMSKPLLPTEWTWIAISFLSNQNPYHRCQPQSPKMQKTPTPLLPTPFKLCKMLTMHNLIVAHDKYHCKHKYLHNFHNLFLIKTQVSEHEVKCNSLMTTFVELVMHYVQILTK